MAVKSQRARRRANKGSPRTEPHFVVQKKPRCFHSLLLKKNHPLNSWVTLKEQPVLFYGELLYKLDNKGAKTMCSVIRNKINEHSIQIMLPQWFYQHSKSPDFIAQCCWDANLFNEHTSHYIHFPAGITLFYV